MLALKEGVAAKEKDVESLFSIDQHWLSYEGRAKSDLEIHGFEFILLRWKKERVPFKDRDVRVYGELALQRCTGKVSKLISLYSLQVILFGLAQARRGTRGRTQGKQGRTRT